MSLVRIYRNIGSLYIVMSLMISPLLWAGEQPLLIPDLNSQRALFQTKTITEQSLFRPDAIDEHSLFQNSNINEHALFQTDDQLDANLSTLKIEEKNSVSFTGKMNMYGQAGIADSARLSTIGDSTIQSYADIDLMLDIRLQKGVKGYVDLYVGQLNTNAVSANASLLFNIKEYFIDFNIERNIYVRTGKQYLKWGHGYFWNPVDFVNQDKKDFLNLDQTLEGAYGVKFHIPEGVDKNWYVFINGQQSDTLTDLSLVARHEFTAGLAEIGVSGYAKRGSPVHVGLDASSYINGFDITFESSFFAGTKPLVNGSTISYENQALHTKMMGQIRKSWAWERPNRVTLLYEQFYQTTGIENLDWTNSNQTDALKNAGLYSLNRLSPHYHSLFFSINEYPFFSSNSFVNVLQNLSDNSAMINIGSTYAFVSECTLSTSVIFYLGHDNSEYRSFGRRMDIRSQLSLVF